MNIRIMPLLLPVWLALAIGSGRAQSEYTDRAGVGSDRRYWLDSTAYPGCSFTWSVDGTVIQSGHLCAFRQKWLQAGIFEISVEVVTPLGCQSILMTGKVLVEPEVTISPNPVCGSEINLIVNPETGSFAAIDLFAPGGQWEGCVFEGKLEGGQPNYIRIRHHFSQGIYTYRIRTEAKTLSGRFVAIPCY